jgi:hypothetical protein
LWGGHFACPVISIDRNHKDYHRVKIVDVLPQAYEKGLCNLKGMRLAEKIKLSAIQKYRNVK